MRRPASEPDRPAARPGRGSKAATGALIRAWLLQALVIAAIGALLWGIAQTTFDNLDRLGVQSGFDFLGKRAGFDINQTLIAYSSDAPVYRAFLVAICNTVLLAVLSIALATALGLAVAVCRISRDWFLNAVGTGFIEIFRNIPALLQIFFWYFVVLRALPAPDASWHLGEHMVLNNRGLFLPGPRLSAALGSAASGSASPEPAGMAAWFVAAALIALVLVRVARSLLRRPALRPVRVPPSRRLWTAAWVVVALAWLAWAVEWQAPWRHPFGYASGLVITPELGALILGLALYNASSVAEVIRAGFLAVPSGQWEAARSLGLSRLRVLRHVVVPQAMRVIVPPLTTCYLNIFKATSLGAALGYPEIVSVMVGTTNNIVGRPVEIMFLTFAVYSLVSLLGIGLMGWLNRRHNRFAAA